MRDASATVNLDRARDNSISFSCPISFQPPIKCEPNLLWTQRRKAGTTRPSLGAVEFKMLYRTGWLCVVLAVGVCGPGCGVMQTAKNVTRESMKPMKMRPSDYRDTTQEVEDEWTSVGRTASTVRAVEKDDDPFRKMLMSPKAMNIERNLGIE